MRETPNPYRDGEDEGGGGPATAMILGAFMLLFSWDMSDGISWLTGEPFHMDDAETGAERPMTDAERQRLMNFGYTWGAILFGGGAGAALHRAIYGR